MAVSASRKVRAKAPRPRTSARHVRGEISTEDVVSELLALFDALGLGPTQIEKKIRKTKRAKGKSYRRPHHATVIGDLLTIWNQDPRYLDKLGNPMPIALEGTGPSFVDLARRCAPQLSAQEILQDLLRLRAVRIDKRKGLITAANRAIAVYGDKNLAALHTLATLHGFISTLRHNLNSHSTNSEQLFHRIAWSKDFDKENLARLKIWLRRHGQHFLESADNWMTRNSARSQLSNRKIKTSQVSIGLYLSVEKNP